MPRPSTPPPRASDPSNRAAASPPTPEVTRRIEESRLKAKALREAHDAARREAGTLPSPNAAGFLAPSGDDAGSIEFPRRTTRLRKRAYDDVAEAAVAARNAPATSRDGRANGVAAEAGDGDGNGKQQGGSSSKKAKRDANDDDNGAIRPARKFAKFVDYDFDKITDTKGGFLAAEDDPYNKAMSGSAASSSANSKKPGPALAPDAQEAVKPAGMTAAAWERLQLLRSLRRQKAGPFEPGLSALQDTTTRRTCRDCGSLEIDFVWDEVFGVPVCARCKEAAPERYSLLTKTEAREDYLLTEPELRDAELLPHLARPNPHKAHWHDMMLFLRMQVEEYAFGPRKWGSAAALDEEFARREAEKKDRKDKKFKAKLRDLKKRTRTEAYRRQHRGLGAGAGSGILPEGRTAAFGDKVGADGKHAHEWGRVVENADGLEVKTCTTCGMEVEELEF